MENILQHDSFFHIYAFHNSIISHIFSRTGKIIFIHCIWPFCYFFHKNNSLKLLKISKVCIFHYDIYRDKDEDKKDLFFFHRYGHTSEVLNPVQIQGFDICHNNNNI